MEIENKKAVLNNLTQTFLKASELEQTDDSISIKFEGENRKHIIPAISSLTEALDDVDEQNVMEKTGLSEDSFDDKEL